MVLLGEQERLLAYEYSFINLSSGTDLSADYGSLVVPTGGRFFAFRYVITADTTYNSAHYVSVSGVRVFSEGNSSLVVGDNVFSGIIWLDAGTYTNVTFNVARAGAEYISSIKAGLCLFNDESHRAWGLYSSTITTVAAAARATPIGNTAKSTVIVQVQAATPSNSTYLTNIGETDTPGVFIQVDGSDVDWTERQTSAPGTGAVSGKLVLEVNAGSSHTIGFRKTDPTTVIYYSVINCPWLLTDTLSFPVQALTVTQDSTVYVTAEPLFLDSAAKTIKVGVVRCCSFGATTDYYTAETGAGILELSYKFDTVDATTSGILSASSWGACISYVGVDLV